MRSAGGHAGELVLDLLDGEHVLHHHGGGADDEAVEFVRRLAFDRPAAAFDAAFSSGE